MRDCLEKMLNVQGVQDRYNGRSGHTGTRFLVPIRVLYTINASSQFLLARQKRKVEVVPIAWGTENGAITSSGLPDTTIGCYRYARIPLKICLGAVCTSSPELLADRSRDYSVYVLDPLESTSTGGNHAAFKPESSPIQSRTSDNTPSSCLLREGVSIGMGLMSWCMTDDRVPVPGADDDDDDNDGCVTGKLVMDRGADALEIVIYLRETALQSQQQHALSLSSLGFYPSSTTSTDYSSQGNAQCMLSVPSSPGINVSSSLPESSQISITGCDPSGERASECGETSIPETASSTSGHPPRVGRPPGSTTNPEKRARRLAIQSHKEMLERMENIAKMQQGREYDKTLIRISDHDIPTVTDEDIARQRKILQELESRPLIVDKSRLLTTKPLPKRPKDSISIVPLSKGSLPKQTIRNESTNATASGSRQNSNDAVSKKRSSNVSTISAVENKHETQLLLSLLTSVLGKVDGPSINQPNSISSQKGKGKETADDALADILKQLLPIIPSAAIQASAVSASCTSPSPANTVPASVPLLEPKVDQWNSFRSQTTLPLSKPPTLFKTAAETFYDSRSGSSGPYDQHWTESAGDQSKVREDAHPVPGGGWARGRNLIPRTATSTHTKSLLPNGETKSAASDPVNSTTMSAAQAQLDKENTPPMKSGRGLKRALSIVGEARDKEDIPHKTDDKKKRKQNSAPAVSNNEPGGTKRTAMALMARDKTNMSGASGPPVAASNPSRSRASAARSLPVMAMSEPDYLSPRPPIVATSMLPDLITEPRTPPRHETSLNDNAGDSLFTPCAPDDEMTSLFRDNTHHSTNELLSSPSVSRKKFHAAHVGGKPSVPEGSQQCPRTESELRPIKTGWDLPPSSPPPPTSPISPQAEIVSEQDDTADLGSIIQLQTGPVEMERSGTDGRFGDWGTTIKSAVASTPVADAFQLPDSSDFDMLTDTDFDFGWLSQVHESTEGVGVELDIEELWSSLGPVIAQAQSDGSVLVNSQTSSQVEADFSYFDLENDQTPIETEEVLQNGVDAAKVAEDLKALFGGCVV